MMTSSRIPLALAVAVLVAGCDRLVTEPGHDFAVRVLTPTPITVVGKISTPVRFAVTGCDAIIAEVEYHLIDPARQADGTYLAEIPVEWLREEHGVCNHDERYLDRWFRSITVTCNDGLGRTASASFEVRYGAALRVSYASVLPPLRSVQYPFPGGDPMWPRALSHDAWAGEAVIDPPVPGIDRVPMRIDDVAPTVTDVARTPLLVENDSSLFVVSGCLSVPADYGRYFPHPSPPPATCPQIQLSPSVLGPSEALWGVGLERDGAPSRHGWWPVWVPAEVKDLAFLADGTLVVLSQSTTPFGTVVARVVPMPPTAAECSGLATCQANASVEVMAYYPGEAQQTGFSRTADGSLVFLTHDYGSSGWVLHGTDGRTVSTKSFSFADSSLLVQLSPDGTAVFADGKHLGPLAGPWTSLPITADSRFAQGIWLKDRFVAWIGSRGFFERPPLFDYGDVKFFEAAPPYALVASYELHPLPGARTLTQLWGAVGVGDKLVLTTNTGVRILDRDGQLVGGADPLPCGLSPTSLAIGTGPTTAAVRAGDYVYVFDLAEPP